MRIAIRVIQILVGLLFIVSGLVKANDPLGLAYKMQEFFELWTADLRGSSFFLKNPLLALISFSNEHSLGLSVHMITVEIIAGVALLLGWMKRWLLPFLLALMVFFTFLTGYAVLSGKFTNCGCFGDCIPITPTASFAKDLVLIVLILALILGRRHIVPVWTSRTRVAALGASLAAVLLLQIYVLRYLPLADCLAFHKGADIAQQTRLPAGSLDSVVTTMIYEKDGKQYEWTISEMPADFETYTFKGTKEKVVRPGTHALPPIQGFTLQGIGGPDPADSTGRTMQRSDSTKAIMETPHCLVFFALHTRDLAEWSEELKAVRAATSLPVFLICNQAFETTYADLAKQGINNIPVYTTDFTPIKTAARTNPTLYEWKKGVIVGKWGRGDLHKVPDHLKTNP